MTVTRDAERPSGIPTSERGNEQAESWRGNGQSPLRLVATVGAAIALCIVGDSLLYSILPLEAPALGFSALQVGLLLSVNRWVRLASNPWVSGLMERWGPRWLFLTACVLGLLSTSAYGIGWGFAVFFVARLVWGVAWSAFRQGGYHAVWSGETAIKGRLTGLLWGVIRLGSAGGVLAGGWLFDRYGYSTMIGVMVVITALALPVAWLIRWPTQGIRRPAAALHTGQKAELRDWLRVLDQPDRRWLTLAGCLQLLSSGVILSTTALFLKGLAPDSTSPLVFGLGIATMSGILQGVRWSSDLAVGPLIGYLSDRFGQPNTAMLLAFCSFCAVAGLALLPPLWAVLCLFIVFICDAGASTTLSAAASGAAIHTARPNLFIGVFTTATDAGSALGPLLAYALAALLGLPMLYLGLGAALLLTVLRYRSWAVNIVRE